MEMKSEQPNLEVLTNESTNRRTVLGGCIAGIVSGTVAVTTPTFAATKGSTKPLIYKKWPLALQLWSVSDQLQKDLQGTLKTIKALGYSTVETARIPHLSPQDLQAALKVAGLVCKSAHFTMSVLESSPEACIEEAKMLGATWIVCALPKTLVPMVFDENLGKFLDANMTREAWQANAEALKRYAPMAKAAKLKMAWHNHFMEFKDLGGENGLDILLNAVGPDDLRLELDLGWVVAAGQEIVPTMNRYKDRLDLLHIKDMSPEPVASSSLSTGYVSREIGKGIVDWKETLSTASALGVKYIFVEQEAPFRRPIFESLAMSRDYLRHLK